MRMYDIILKKRNGESLSKEEIDYFICEYTNGNIPDYQASALMMAIYFNGMNKDETVNLTLAMASSGEQADLSSISGIKVDKHSTGGVGDKTSLIVVPIVAACGAKVAKMSGRGLGHTGGTIDKLESIEGFNTSLSKDEFFNAVNKHGLCIIGQSMNIAPADKKLYALRDVTATVDNISLIASSIMSKKLAAGSDCIVLDVKVGSGAFMKTEKEAHELAREMVDIGNSAGRKTVAVITNMDIPLGSAVGNNLEVIEAIEILNGNGDEQLRELCLTLSAYMLSAAGFGSFDDCFKKAADAVKNKTALNKLAEMTEAQGGNKDYIFNPSLFPKAEFYREVKLNKSGYISKMDTQNIGTVSVLLGAGREKKEDSIDYSAGIKIVRKTGDIVNENDTVAVLYSNDESCLDAAERLLRSSVTVSKSKPEMQKIILGEEK